MERPQQPYLDLFRKKGILWEQQAGVLTIRGELEPGEYPLPGDVSSQFVTGLLYALPLLEGDSRMEMTSPLQSRGYVEMTLETLRAFGIQVENQGYKRFLVPGGQLFASRDTAIEGDWSQGGFWYAAKALGNPVTIQGLREDSPQGDRVVAEHFSLLCQPGDTEIDRPACDRPRHAGRPGMPGGGGA